MQKLDIAVISGLVLAAFGAGVGQTAGTGFTYQGQLRQAGRPFDGTADLIFDLYDAPIGGNLIGTHAQFGVMVTNGLFTVVLNDHGEFGPNAFNGDGRWLEILVDFVPMSPRQEITSSPYALQTRGIFVADTGEVGIGTKSPQWKLHVAGDETQHGIKVSVPDGLQTHAQVVFSAGLEPQYDQGAVIQLNAPSASIDPNAMWVLNRTAGPLTLGTSNQPVMRLAPSGNVAIGTTSADTWKLHVMGGVHDGIKVEVPDGPDTSAQVVLSAGLEPQYGQGAIFQLNAPSNAIEPNTLLVVNRTNGPLVLGTGNQHRVDITAAGDVGIGTTSPLARLHAVADGTFALYGETSIPGGRGVVGHAGATTGDGVGVVGTSFAENGTGVRGFVTGEGHAVGVHGQANFAGTGVLGEGKLGGYFVTNVSDGVGVHGVNVASSGSNYAGRFENTSTNGTGVSGEATASTGETFGGRFTDDSDSGTGVFAHATSFLGSTSGVTARVDSPDGVAVRAINTSTGWLGPAYAIYATTGGTAQGSSAAVVGHQTAAGNMDTFGVVGTRGEPSDIKTFGLPTGGAGVCGYSDRGIGIYGRSANSQFNGIGVFGVAEDAIGVQGAGSEGVTGNGWVSNAGDTAAGGFFQGADSGSYPDGHAYGVLAETTETGISPIDAACGVLGKGGTAIRGESTVANGNGVVGIANGASGWAIYGKSDVGLAGVFDGTVQVNGTLNAFTKNFLIDHPLDPQNKYLVHSTIESSEQLNSYTGNVVLDGSGKTTVQLPEWFEAINTDFRYQLTCIGGFAPVYIAREIRGNSFDIAGGTARLKVSWTVTAVRNDAYARANPLVVEKPKPEHERGYYLYPQGFAEGGERGMLTARAALSERMQSNPEVVAVRKRMLRDMDARMPKTVRPKAEE